MIPKNLFPISTIFLVVLSSISVTYLSCEDYPADIVDTGLDAVSLSSVLVAPLVINTDTINVGPERKPEDALPMRLAVTAAVQQPVGRSAAVKYSLSYSQQTRVIVSGTLRNDGVAPDGIAGDSVYAAYVQFQLVRAELTTLYLEVWPEDHRKNRGTGWILPIRIIRSNQAPLISNLVAPDTVQIGGQNRTLLLQVRASDPDGLTDIRRVIFNSYRPDGLPSTGNPFSMFDDGDASGSGDPVAGDGIYSRRVLLPASTTPGTYRFEFQAADRSNALSNIISHRITMIP